MSNTKQCNPEGGDHLTSRRGWVESKLFCVLAKINFFFQFVYTVYKMNPGFPEANSFFHREVRNSSSFLASPNRNHKQLHKGCKKSLF